MVEARLEFQLQLLDALVSEFVRHNARDDIMRKLLLDRGYDPEQIEATVRRVRSRPRYSTVSRVGPPGKWRRWLRGDGVHHLVLAFLCAGAFGLAFIFDAGSVGLFFLIIGVRSLFRAVES
jgi:hypothetical protein